MVFVVESPAKHELEQGIPLVGVAGKMADLGWQKAGIDRSKVRIINLVPVRAPHDKFEEHSRADLDWGYDMFRQELAMLKGPKVIIPMGFHPLNWLSGGRAPVANSGGLTPYTDSHGNRHGGIGDWRGSILPVRDEILSLWPQWSPIVEVAMVPTYHPAAVSRQMEYHVDFIRDLKRAKQLSEGRLPPHPVRTFYLNDYAAFDRLVNEKWEPEAGKFRPVVDLIAFDTEQNPDLVSIASEDEIHVFDPMTHAEFLPLLKRLMESPYVCKVAHNFQHDAVYLRVKFDIHIIPPRFDTMGGAHILNPSLEKSLSPGIGNRFTSWFYHKWLEQVAHITYSGIDAAVTYDAFWPIQDEISARDLRGVSSHDHTLMDIFTEMTVKGFKVNTAKRREVEAELTEQLEGREANLEVALRPVIEAKLSKFEKPHLFQESRKCDCCGGGSKQARLCLTCSGLPEDVPLGAIAKSSGLKIAEVEALMLPCVTCATTGKVQRWLPFNSDSGDQVADVIYKGLGIPERRFKGKRTVRIKALEPIRDRHPLIADIIDTQALRAEQETVARLTPGPDGRLHCVFDPWGTISGRVAGKEGLILPGTNPMNIPKAARVFVEADVNQILLYPDMEQIEARNVAVLSGDSGLKQALVDIQPEKGRPDIHLFVQKAFATVNALPVDPTGVHSTRDMVKKTEYAAFYGIRAANLAKEAGYASTEHAQKALDAFGYLFPGVPKWHRDTLAEALDTRILKSPTGRVREWDGYIYDAKTKSIAYETAKEMWSFKPQDMAAWVLALGAMDLAKNHDWITLLIHVHDALVMQAPLTRQEEAVTIAVGALTRRLWGMDYPAEMKVGHNWKEASGG